MGLNTRLTGRIATGVVLVGMSLALATPAGAVPGGTDTVSQTITGGDRTASVANLVLGSVGYSHMDQGSPGEMTLTVDDSTGTGAGWNTTILSSAFVYTGDNGGTPIPAANFWLTSVTSPTETAGQAVDTGGPKIPDTLTLGNLSAARKTIQADAGFGQGTYTQPLGVLLAIPAQARAGTYTGTLTTTIAAAP